MSRDFYIEVNSQQRNHDGERICGDVFLYRYIKEEDRVIAVLSDGFVHQTYPSQSIANTWVVVNRFTSVADRNGIARVWFTATPVGHHELSAKSV